MDKIIKARTSLILDHPFFGCLALRLVTREDTNIPTANTDGESLSYNPDFINSLTLAEVIGIVAHEVMHCAMGHHWRMEHRNVRKWNIACDYAVNLELVSVGFTLPASRLLDSRYTNMSAEQIYDLLPDSSSSEQDPDPGKCGGVTEPQDEAKRVESAAEWKVAVTQAAEVSAKQGSLPDSIQRMVKDILYPPLPWYTLLRDFVERTARNDYSWSRPSPRYFSQGLVLPSLISEELPEVVVAVDTSGSISEEDLSRFAEETSAVLGAYNTTVRVVYCDAQVHGEEEYTRADLPLKLKPMGGGGTDFRPVFEHIAGKGLTPSCLIYLTDGYGKFPQEEAEYPVLWVMTTDVKAPNGVTIKFN